MYDLAAKFERLNEQQQKAVQQDSNTVVLAGPGSGKTDTLVIKVAHLLSTTLQPPRGLACITYNNDTVREFKSRLAEFGIYGNRRLFLGTVHSFCLNCVLRPYARLVIPEFEQGVQVAVPSHAQAILNEMLKREYPGIKQKVDDFTKLRRRLACREDMSDFPPQFIEIFEAYQVELSREAVVDFEEMVALALTLIEEHPWIRNALSARFPWLVVDEYQDLGGPLHRIVTQLVDNAGIKVFAVGDPDQTIYPFTGADPKYLMQLAGRGDCEAIRLRFNYRSGRRLIQASEAALALSEPRDYEPDPERKDEGEVYFHNVPDGLDGQAGFVAEELVPRLGNQVPLEEIAILYRGKGRLFDALQSKLTRANVSFIAERDGRYPRSPIVRWLQDCAVWCLSDFGSCQVLFEDLLRFFHGLLQSAGQATSDMPDLEIRRLLYETLASLRNPELDLGDWLLDVDHTLNLRLMINHATDFADALDDFEQLIAATEAGRCLEGYRLMDFSNEGKIKGKVTLTTLHSSKGRQFDAVIMPGLQETIFPYRRWSRRSGNYEEPLPKALMDDRRLFYVGFTRARKYVFLVYSDIFTNKWNYEVDLGPSRFVFEVKQRLEEIEQESLPF
jgi:DNA helicase-2/ATP-dependent DNA helicase PcrA